MNTFELSVTSLAVLFSPLVALQVQSWLEKIKAKRERRLSIFHTLMGTRAARLSASHVEALNRIDIEFYGVSYFGNHHMSKQEKEIVDSWRLYRDHLNASHNPKEVAVWATKGEELFTDLLYQLSKIVGYDFDKVYLRRSVYSPIAHSNHEINSEIITSQLIRVLTGDQAIAITSPLSDNQLSSAQNKIVSSSNTKEMNRAGLE